MSRFLKFIARLLNPEVSNRIPHDIVGRVGIGGYVHSDPRLFALDLLNNPKCTFRNVNLFTRVITSSPIFMVFFPPDRNDNLAA